MFGLLLIYSAQVIQSHGSKVKCERTVQAASPFPPRSSLASLLCTQKQIHMRVRYTSVRKCTSHLLLLAISLDNYSVLVGEGQNDFQLHSVTGLVCRRTDFSNALDEGTWVLVSVFVPNPDSRKESSPPPTRLPSSFACLSVIGQPLLRGVGLERLGLLCFSPFGALELPPRGRKLYKPSTKPVHPQNPLNANRNYWPRGHLPPADARQTGASRGAGAQAGTVPSIRCPIASLRLP